MHRAQSGARIDRLRPVHFDRMLTGVVVVVYDGDTVSLDRRGFGV